jgi:hypothetical protein
MTPESSEPAKFFVHMVQRFASVLFLVNTLFNNTYISLRVIDSYCVDEAQSAVEFDARKGAKGGKPLKFCDGQRLHAEVRL